MAIFSRIENDLVDLLLQPININDENKRDACGVFPPTFSKSGLELQKEGVDIKLGYQIYKHR